MRCAKGATGSYIHRNAEKGVLGNPEAKKASGIKKEGWGNHAPVQYPHSPFLRGLLE